MASRGTRAKPALPLAALALAVAACAPTITHLETPTPRSAPTARHGPAAADETHGAAVQPPIDLTALQPVQHDPPLQVVTTLGQITDIAKSVGGGRVHVTQIVPGNDDPHRYVPTPSDVAAFSRADVIFYNGLFLEGQMGEILAQLSGFGIPSAAVTAGLDPTRLLTRESSPGVRTIDPHIWFDTDLWTAAAANVTAVLRALDPGGEQQYRANLAAYAEELSALREWGRAQIASIPPSQRLLITSHDAFGYFGRHFGLQVMGLQGLSTEAEAGTRDVSELAELVLQRGIQAMFVEASVSPEAIGAVAEAVGAGGGDVRIGGELYGDSPGVQGTAEGSYPGMVMWNIATVVKALGGQVAPVPRQLATEPRWDYAYLVQLAVAEAVADQ